FWAELGARLAKFRLELHPEKTRLLEFGASAADDRQRAGLGKPETFNFLGFTHICGETREGRFTVVRQAMRKRVQAKLGGGESRTLAPLARPALGGGGVAALGDSRPPAVLRRADELAGVVDLLWPGGASLVPGVSPAQSTGVHRLVPDAAAS